MKPMYYKLVREHPTENYREVTNYDSLADCMYHFGWWKEYAKDSTTAVKIMVKVLTEDHATDVLYCYSNDKYIDLYI